ncbi:hypothetical protein AAG906_035853 [Vitis piasezkii]
MLARTRASSHLICSCHMRIQTSLKSQDIGKTALATIVSIKVAGHEVIAVRKDAYPSLIVHSPKRPRRSQGELMDTTNPSICQQLMDMANPPICQQHGVDYTEVFAPVARMNTPRGYEQNDNPHKVYKLKKALYGLKQAPQAWFSSIEAHFVNEGFERCHSEHTLFVKTSKGGKILILSLYSSMMREFDMTDLGKMRCVEKIWDGGEQFIHSPIILSFKVFKDENGVKVDATFFKQMVGSLMYLTATRPDLMFVVSLISRYMGQPTELHLQTAKRVLRYLRGTTNLGIFYKKGGNDKLVAFTDCDYAGDLEDRKSTSRYVFMLTATSCMSSCLDEDNLGEAQSYTR